MTTGQLTDISSTKRVNDVLRDFIAGRDVKVTDLLDTLQHLRYDGNVSECLKGIDLKEWSAAKLRTAIWSLVSSISVNISDAK